MPATWMNQNSHPSFSVYSPMILENALKSQLWPSSEITSMQMLLAAHQQMIAGDYYY